MYYRLPLGPNWALRYRPLTGLGGSSFRSNGSREARAIATDAYIYLYSLATMDETRGQFTKIVPGKELGKRPTTMFNNAPEYPPAANFIKVLE